MSNLYRFSTLLENLSYQFSVLYYFCVTIQLFPPMTRGEKKENEKIPPSVSILMFNQSAVISCVWSDV